MGRITLGANIPAIAAQRQLSRSSDRLSTSFERLASGQRINRASDDAAGLSVADSLRSQRRISGAASRNISDGISLLNIAQSAMQSQIELLSRLSELAEQSANGVYTNDQRKSINTEYQSLLKEFGRIAETTKFNGINPLIAGRSDGIENILIQAGLDGSSSSQLSASATNTTTLSGILSNSSLLDGDGGFDVGDYAVYSAFIGTGFPHGAHTFSITDSNGVAREIAVAAIDYTDDGSYGGSYSSGNPTVSFVVLSRIANQSNWESVTGIQGGGGTGYDFAITFDEYTGKPVAGDANYSTSVNFSSGATASFSLDFSGTRFKFNEQQTAIDFTSLSTQSSSRKALDIVSARSGELANILGAFGSFMSRFQVAENVNSVTRENTAAAESRIRDVDIAEESAALLQSNILREIGGAILGQANTLPQLALRLLSP